MVWINNYVYISHSCPKWWNAVTYPYIICCFGSIFTWKYPPLIALDGVRVDRRSISHRAIWPNALWSRYQSWTVEQDMTFKSQHRNSWQPHSSGIQMYCQTYRRKFIFSITNIIDCNKRPWYSNRQRLNNIREGAEEEMHLTLSSTWYIFIAIVWV